MDSGIGLLLDYLQHSGTADNTIVIFATDHGVQFSRGKTAIYEGGLKIPFILRGPTIGTIGSEGLIREELVSLVDILPAVTGLAGIDCPDSVAGQSLIQESLVGWREYLFAEWYSAHPPIHFPQRSVRDKKFKMILNLLQDRPSPSAIGYAGYHVLALGNQALVRPKLPPLKTKFIRPTKPTKIHLSRSCTIWKAIPGSLII